MMSGSKLVGAMVAAVAVSFAVAALSQAPYTLDADRAGIVRLSWRVRGEVREQCRTRSPEELAALPPHMRTLEDCDGRVPPYRLTVAIDGSTVVDELVTARGRGQSRPVYVLREIGVEPGPHSLFVSFGLEPDSTDAVAPALELEEQIDLLPRSIHVVSVDSGTGRLTVLGRSR